MHSDNTGAFRTDRVPPALDGKDVHVWRIALSKRPIDTAEALLSADEMERAGRLRIEAKRRQYVQSRAALREILAGYLDTPPETLDFAYGPQGKPALGGACGGTDLEFNLSHSGDWTYVAVTRGAAVGIDVEEIAAKRDDEKLADRFFSKAEAAALRALPEAERPAAFFRCWTCKEAFIKALGEGLSCPLDSFDVALPPHDAALLEVRGKPGESSEWFLHALEAPKGYAAAVAVRNPHAHFAEFDFATS